MEKTPLFLMLQDENSFKRYYESINSQTIVIGKYGKNALVPNATSNVKLFQKTIPGYRALKSPALREFKYL